MDFKKDIFLSYAHIDNESLLEGDKGWISEFHRSLEIRLAQLLGEKPNIWRDTSLDGNHRFSEEIVDQFADIAILVSILTPRYVNSEWCVKEVKEFCKASEQNVGVYINNKARIFKVIKTPVDINEHPEEMRGLLGYEFFKIDNETKRIKEFSKVYGPEVQQEYWSKLDDIAHDISTLLRELKTEQSREITDGPKVYLAETTSDRNHERELIHRFLKEKGCQVYPNKNLSLVSSEYQQQVEEMLSNCEMSIHLLGANYGIIPEGTNTSKVELQNNLAAKQDSQSFKQIVWMPPALEATDDRQKEYLQNIKAGKALSVETEFLIGPLEELKFTIKKKLEKEPEKPKTVQQESGPKGVYLICDEDDLNDVLPIEDYLFDQGFNVTLPVFDGDQTELREDHQENLINCDGVLIYYNKGNELWVRSKLRDLMKLAGYGRKKPLTAKAVILAGDDSPQKSRFRSHDLAVINMIEKPDASALHVFTNQLTETK